jgi:hypothetical protein
MRKRLEEDPESLTRLPGPNDPAFNSIPLMNAISVLHIDCVKFLLEAGSNPNTVDTSFNNNPLIMALHIQATLNFTGDCLNKVEQIIELLIMHGASRFVPHLNPPISKCTYLDYAVQSTGWKLTEMLIEHGCHIENLVIDSEKRCISRNRKIPISTAIKHKNVKALQLLLLHGATVSFYFDVPFLPFKISHFIMKSYISDMKEGKITGVIEVLKTCKLHGVNLWEEDGSRNILEKLQQQEWFANNNELETEVETLMKTPLSLQSQCRLVFKKCFGKKYCDRIEMLPLPQDIIVLLQFPELD